MAYSSTFYRVTQLYTIRDTDEIAQTSYDVGPAIATTPLTPPTTAFAEAHRDNWITFMNNIIELRADYSIFVGTKVAAIGLDGHYTADPVSVTVAGGGVAGNEPQLPPQCSVVISLRASTSLGKGNRGRVYLPHTGIPAANLPTMSTTIRDFYLAEAVTAFSTINDIVSPDGPAQLRIMSQALPTPSNKAVVSLRCGRVIDTQRRRRNALDEDYASTVLT